MSSLCSLMTPAILVSLSGKTAALRAMPARSLRYSIVEPAVLQLLDLTQPSLIYLPSDATVLGLELAHPLACQLAAYPQGRDQPTGQCHRETVID